MTRVALVVVCAAAAFAQQAVAPTPAPVGPGRGDNTDGYNVINSFETGYRFLDVRGDEATYRSDVNFGNGLRLLGSTLMVNSREGHGRFFDSLTLRTQGLGNDPYEFSSLRVDKNRIYRYDFTWRLQDYFNPALAIAHGAHFMNTQRRMQDHDFTLLPQSRIKLFLGYSRNAQDGPALSTVLDLQSSALVSGLLANIRRLENEYRLGGEVTVLGARFTFLRGWVRYSEGTAFHAGSPDTVETARTEPYRGSSPYWRLNLQKDSKSWVLGARYAWSSSRRDFFFDETAIGTARFGGAQNQQTLVSGAGSRMVGAGDLTITVFPGGRFTLTNQTSFYNTRMQGDNTLEQLDNATLSFNQLAFELLGLRTIANSTDASLTVSKWLGFYGGYHVSTRRIRSAQSQAAEGALFEQNNTLNAGLFGVRLQPAHPLSLNLDAEIGRANRPFFPVSEKNYQALGARLQYRTRTLLLSASARSNYNTNSVSLANYASRGRDYSLNASWTALSWLGLDGTYSKMHLDTLGALAYFSENQLITGDRSLYISNLHFANAMARFGLGTRAELSLGYSRVQDLGDGRSAPGPAPFVAAQTFPLTFESPLARISVRLNPRLRWNAGWQFYHYREKFAPRLYDANTGYTSLLWSF